MRAKPNGPATSYQVTPSGAISPEVTLILGNGARVVGQMVSISGSGASVMVPVGSVGLQLSCQLRLRAFELPYNLQLRATVRARRVAGEQERVELRFDDWSRMRASLPCALQALFNLRRSPRIPVHADSALAVSLRLSGQHAWMPVGALGDLTCRGVGLRMCRVGVGVGGAVSLSFRPWRGGGELRAPAVVRHRSVGGYGVELGLELHPNAPVPARLRYLLSEQIAWSVRRGAESSRRPVAFARKPADGCLGDEAGLADGLFDAVGV